MQDIFIARQPIVDRKESLVAFELLFRSAHSATASGGVDDTRATAQVLVNAFGEMGIADVLGAHKRFINLDAEILHSDLIELLPKQRPDGGGAEQGATGSAGLGKQYRHEIPTPFHR